jgi:hypothetical protein
MSVSPKYVRLEQRVEEFVAEGAPGAPPPICLRIVVDHGASRTAIKAAQKQAIAEHLEKFPQDRGRAIDLWISRTIVDADREQTAEAAAEVARALDKAPGIMPPTPTAQSSEPPAAPRDPNDPPDFYDGAARDWRNNPP